MHFSFKTRYNGKVVLLFLCLAFSFSSFHLTGQEQIGRPFITNYSYQEYEAHPTNWWALEDKDGIMYFANNDGLLQYDGVNWNLIDTEVGVRCMVYDDQDVMHVGGANDFGYMKPNAKGELE